MHFSLLIFSIILAEGEDRTSPALVTTMVFAPRSESLMMWNFSFSSVSALSRICRRRSSPWTYPRVWSFFSWSGDSLMPGFCGVLARLPDAAADAAAAAFAMPLPLEEASFSC